MDYATLCNTGVSGILHLYYNVQVYYAIRGDGYLFTRLQNGQVVLL